MSFLNLSAISVKERSVTLFFIILSVLGGLYAFVAMGRAEDPNFTVRAMVVSAIWPGATPEQLQLQVVDRLEKRIQEVQYFHKVETSIRPGRADLVIQFKDYSPNAVIPELLYQVRKRMQDEAPYLPKGVIGPIVNDDFSDVYFTLTAVTAPGMPMRELTREVEHIRDRLARVDGVYKVVMFGEHTERMFIDFDTAKLSNLGTNPEAIFKAIQANNELISAGSLELDGPRAYIRIDADLSDPDALAAVPVKVGDRLLRLSDLATIKRGYEDPPSYLIRSRGKDALLLGIVMNQGENGLKFGQRIASFLDQEKSLLPLGINLEVLTNQTDAISAAVNLFQLKFLIALLVVMAVSILAIGLRAGLVIGIAVPLTLGLTFLLMKFTGINLDRITLGALIIALGLLVDDAIIAIEMMIVKMEAGWDRVKAASHAWNVTASPMLFGTLVTVTGFVPIGFARSSVGEYAGNIFWVLAYALLISWVVAVTFTPYLGVMMLPANKPVNHDNHPSLYDTPLYQRLRRLISSCITYRFRVVTVTVGLLILSAIAMATVVQQQFFPSSNRPEVMVGIYLPQGTAIKVTNKTTQKLEHILEKMPEVKTLSAYVGAGAPRFFISANPEQPDSSFAKIIIVAQSSAARDKIIDVLNQHIDNGDFIEARIRVSKLVVGPPVPWPVSFRVVGEDPMLLRKIAHQVSDVMAANPHVVDPHLESDQRTPVLRFASNSDNLRLMGLTPNDISRQLQFKLDGAPITEVREDIRTVKVIARSAKGKTAVPELVEIRNQTGNNLALSQLGKFKVDYEEPVIKRVNRERALMVQTDVKNAQAPDVTMAIWHSLASVRNALPPGYRIDIAGSVEESGKANESIAKLQPIMVALMLIFIMLQMRTFIGTFMVIATAPLGLIGAVLALLLFNQPFGFVALLGLTGLAGIIMRNTMILTQQVQDNLNEGMQTTPAIIEATVQRARPVLLTALAAVLAFVPLTHDTFWGPLAFVLIGGVAVGTIITLMFVPALYSFCFNPAKTSDV